MYIKLIYEFRGNAWNVGHIAEHGVTPEEVEYVVNAARAPFPEYRGDGKYFVTGQAADGTYLQVIYILDAVDCLYVIHARPLTHAEKRRYRGDDNEESKAKALLGNEHIRVARSDEGV